MSLSLCFGMAYRFVRTAPRRAIPLLVLPALAGCAPDPKTYPAQAPSSERLSTESEKKVARENYVGCLFDNARQLDDGRSDAATIGSAVRSACRALYLKSMAVAIQGESQRVKQGFYERVSNSNSDIEMATSAVLRVRSNNRSVPTTRPAPAAPSPPSTPPPMIPS